MLKLSVRDFRGCERADIEVSPIALVTGLNGAGKSSILRATASAVSGQVLPLGTYKKDAGVLVRSGSQGGTVVVAGESGACRASWPAAEVSTDGEAPRSSLFAAGIVSVVGMDATERARVLAEYLKADPNRDDLADALRDAEVTDEEIGKVWERVERHGWDGAAEQCKTNGAAAKREWERLTGEKYGSAKAATWVPQGWALELATMSEDDLQQEVATARASQEKAVRAEAVGAERIAQLAEQAGRLDSLKQSLRTTQSKATKAKADENEARAALNALPAVPGNENVSTCPCCSGALAVKVMGPGKYLLEKVEPVDDSVKEEYRQAISAAQAVLADATSVANRLDNEVRSLEAGIKLAEQAKTEHERLSREAGDIGAAGTVDEARAALARAEGRLRALQTKGKADALHIEVTVLTAVVKALAPEGVRKRRLLHAVEAFNTSILEPLCEAAGWKPVTLTEELATQYGGRPYALLSDSEQYRVRITLQLAMARLDGSSLVIIDGAEILDPAGRNGLFSVLIETEMLALVGMTVAAAVKAPDLSAHGLGTTYWIEAGQCRAIGAGQQGRAA